MQIVSIKKLAGLVFLLGILLTGCTTTKPIKSTTADSSAQEKATLQPPVATEISVVRYGRYRLVEIGATRDQQDLLEQLIDITVPPPSQKQNASVADAMRYVLLRSGYELCNSQDTPLFENLPLPIAHHHLGPTRIKEALTLLAGQSWSLQVDHYNRKVCFTALKESAIKQPKPLIKEVQP